MGKGRLDKQIMSIQYCKHNDRGTRREIWSSEEGLPIQIPCPASLKASVHLETPAALLQGTASWVQCELTVDSDTVIWLSGLPLQVPTLCSVTPQPWLHLSQLPQGSPQACAQTLELRQCVEIAISSFSFKTANLPKTQRPGRAMEDWLCSSPLSPNQQQHLTWKPVRHATSQTLFQMHQF